MNTCVCVCVCVYRYWQKANTIRILRSMGSLRTHTTCVTRANGRTLVVIALAALLMPRSKSKPKISSAQIVVRYVCVYVCICVCMCVCICVCVLRFVLYAFWSFSDIVYVMCGCVRLCVVVCVCVCVCMWQVLSSKMCKKRPHKDYLMWKCRYCCKIAVWFWCVCMLCFASTSSQYSIRSYACVCVCLIGVNYYELVWYVYWYGVCVCDNSFGTHHYCDKHHGKRSALKAGMGKCPPKGSSVCPIGLPIGTYAMLV